MRSSIALILGAAAICFVSAAPSQAGGNQLCRPTATNPLIWTCDGGGFENSVAYSTNFYGPSISMKGGHSCGYGYGPTAARGASSSSSSTGSAGAGAGS